MARQPMTLSPAAPRSTRGRPARTQVPAPMRRTRRGRGRCAAPACALCRRANSYLVVSPPTWVIATGIVTVLVFILAAVLSSPDVPPVSLATWGRLAPADFMGTAVSELNGTGETAMYGPPYNNGTASVQRIGISWQQLAGVRIPIDTATDFVLDPLTREAPTDPVLARALDSYLAAPAHTPSAWEGAYLKALDHVTFHNGAPVVPAAPDGPVPMMIATELSLARSGALDANLIANQAFYGTNFTLPFVPGLRDIPEIVPLHRVVWRNWNSGKNRRADRRL